MPLRRGPQAPGGFIVPPRTRTPRASAFPLLPMLAAAFLMLGAAQLAFWWWEARLPGVPERAQAARPTGSPAWTRWWQADAPREAGQVRQVQRLAAPARPENLQFGDAMAQVVVTVFTDPSCGLCREQVRQWTAGLPSHGVKLVYKFWPANPERKTPGMLVEMARRDNVAGDFWRSLTDAGSADIDDATLLTMLDRAGVPLDSLRGTLVKDGADLMMVLEPDLKLARDANLPPPPVLLVDTYVVDGVVLRPDRLDSYVRKRMEGEPLFERDDLWLMKK